MTDPEDHTTLDDPPSRRPRLTPWLLLLLALGIGFVLGRVGDAPAPPAPQEHTHEPSSAWTCAMHPQIQSPQSGACPICGMDLVQATAPQALSPTQVQLTPRARALARIATTSVTTTSTQSAGRELFGRVVEDEGARRAVTSWISGRVDKLHVTTTGARVRRGQALARMYSPEVYSAHQELLVGLAQLERVPSADPYAKRAAESQVEAARQRLRLLGFTSKELEKMARADKPWTQVSIRSTATGTILRRDIRQGEYVKKGDVLFELSNLKNVWVELDAYEPDLERLEVGQRVQLHIDALPGPTRSGLVTFIDPVLDPKTRVAALRVEVPNADRRIKPGMYTRATLAPRETPPGQPLPLVIPRSAPLFAGARALVYVEVSSGSSGSTYEAREITLGARLEDKYVVESGLQRGERVVTHGAFALDSDLQIRGDLSLMARPDDTNRPAAQPTLTLTSAERTALAPILTGYLDVQERLANDEFENAIARARAWSQSISKVEFESREAHAAWKGLRRRLEHDLALLEGAETIESARTTFSSTTEILDAILAQFGNVLDVPIRRAFCPMANQNKGDHWYQRGDTVDNVYFGNQMRQCGEIKRTLKVGEYAMLGVPTRAEDQDAR